MRRVVITGVGAVTPLGLTAEDSWNGIKNKKCGICEITAFDPVNHNAKVAGQINDINFEDYLDAKEVKNNDRFVNLAIIASDEAMKQSKLDVNSIDKTRFGVQFTSGIGGISTIQDQVHTMYEKGVNRISPYFVPKSLINLSAGTLAIRHKAMGYVTSTVTACAASTNAMGDAYLRILFDQEDVILTGGAEAAICPIGIGGFQALRALTTNPDPKTASVPFDKKRAGFVMGEGATCFILEELEHAKARGAEILGEIVGYGCSCDANHITAPLLDGSGIAIAMEKAIKMAKIKPCDIGYVNAHGTSTKINDATESKAINLVFKDHVKNLYVSSTKGNTGHLLGATGAMEAFFCVNSLRDGIIPPTINTNEVDEECNLNLPLDVVKKDYDYAMSNSLGFGGHNASIIIKKWRV